MWILKRVEKETESNCWHCGASIKYSCWIENDETQEVLAVGKDCCKNFMTKKEYKIISNKFDAYVKYIKIKEKIDNTIKKYENEGKSKKSIAWFLRSYIYNHEIIKVNYPKYYEG